MYAPIAMTKFIVHLICTPYNLVFSEVPFGIVIGLFLLFVSFDLAVLQLMERFPLFIEVG